jgi:predicted DNA binding protein
MGTIVDVIVPTAQFALDETFGRLPDASFETVCVVAHEPGGVMPFVWGSADDLDALDDALRADDSTKRVTRLAEEDGRGLYRIDWHRSVKSVVDIFIETNSTMLRATGRDNRWELRVLFPDQESVSRTYESWREHGVDPSIRRVNGVEDVVSHGGMDLSRDQHEALVTAFEHDYYCVPRGVTLDGLADELGVSHQALSERLRRGHRNLVQTTLCESPNPINRKP